MLSTGCDRKPGSKHEHEQPDGGERMHHGQEKAFS